jgi:hypothetical protein
MIRPEMSMKQAEGILKSTNERNPPTMELVTIVPMAISICVEVGPWKG